MTTSIVFTFIGADRPGLVEKIAKTVSAHHGNWLESRMTQLAGQFAGITRISVAPEHYAALRDALKGMSNDDLTITVQVGSPKSDAKGEQRQLSVIGNDRPGIVREISSALAARGINVLEMNTNITSAPMTAEPLFEATAKIQIESTTDIEELSDKLEEIADDLTIEITLD